VVTWSRNAAGSSTGPPINRTTPNSRFGWRFAGGSVSSNARTRSSLATAYDSRSYTGDTSCASRAANPAYIPAVVTVP
jgi:hypothetical protein